MKTEKATVSAAAFSADGKIPATATSKNIKLWEVATGKELATLNGHTDLVWSLAFSPDGKTLASGSWDNTIKLWDVASGKERSTLKGHTDEVWCVAYSPDGKLLVTGSKDKTIRLWDLATGVQK